VIGGKWHVKAAGSRKKARHFIRTRLTGEKNDPIYIKQGYKIYGKEI